jgi:hypothetical protein
LDSWQAKRLVVLEAEMQQANTEYIRAVARASACPSIFPVIFAEIKAVELLYTQVSDVLKGILDESDVGMEAPG